MTHPFLRSFFCAIFVALIGCAPNAHAVRLQVASEAPAWAHAGAAVLLYLHIGGGAIGILAGVLASVSTKGKRVHRAAGKLFVMTMFVAYLIGAGVAPFLTEGQRPNFVAGVLALYLLTTGVLAARRRPFEAGLSEWLGLGVALIVTGMGLLFMNMGLNSTSGTVDGSPPQAFVLFVIVGGLAMLGEIHALVRRSLTNTVRVSRHLWRMCASFFIASGSLFLGQPQVFPAAFNDTLWPATLAFSPLLVMIAYLVLVRIRGRRASLTA